MAEALLIARLKLQHLLQDEQWEEAAAVGMRGLRAASDAPRSHASDEEATRIALAAASSLGMLVDADLVARFLCRAHSCEQRLPQPLLREATESWKRQAGHDVEAWRRGILRDGPASLETLDAALELLDTTTSHIVVTHPSFQATIQQELCSPDEARRAAALQSVGTAVLTTPALAVPLVPVLVRAFFVETDPLKHVALANLLDASFALSRLPPPPAEGSDVERVLESLMQWLPQLLYAPARGLQALAALGLGRLVLHRADAPPLADSAVAPLGRTSPSWWLHGLQNARTRPPERAGCAAWEPHGSPLTDGVEEGPPLLPTSPHL